MSGIASFFEFAERGTTLFREARAGLTTFLVLVYGVLLNAAILSNPDGAGLDPVSVAVATALVAGVASIVVGLVGNIPIVIAASLGLNALVSFQLAGEFGLGASGALGIVVLSGLGAALLVALGLRGPLVRAFPPSLKLAIGAAVGAYLIYSGLSSGGLIAGQSGFPPAIFVFPTTTTHFVALAGLILTVVLWIRRVPAALLIGIVATSVVAYVAGLTAVTEDALGQVRLDTVGMADIASPLTDLPILIAVMTILSVLILDYFDSFGTLVAVSGRVGLTTPEGDVPVPGRILFVDALSSVAGGLLGGGASSASPDSGAGIADGGRTGLTAIVAGLLFLALIPVLGLASLVPPIAAAPALILAGVVFFGGVARDIPFDEPEDALPAILTILVTPVTYSIATGIGIGVIAWVLVRVVQGRFREVPLLLWLVTAAFLVYLLQGWIRPFLV